MSGYVQYAEPYPHSRGDRFGATEGRVRPHRGQDTAPGGDDALALADGVIVRKLWSNELGHVTVLAHADGKYTGAAHTATESVFALGTPVRRGRSIGAAIGSTGTAAVGRHYHYTLGDDVEGIISGHVQDPLAYIAAHGDHSSGAASAATPLPTAPQPIGEPPVFIIQRNGWTALVLPAENGKLFAAVLGGQDRTAGMAVVNKEDAMGWTALRARFVNKDIIPA